MSDVRCKVSECDGQSYAKGFCSIHYGRQLRFGNPLGRQVRCVVCSKDFIRSTGKANTCSPECSAARKKRAKRAFDSQTPSLKGSRECETCGKAFVGRTNQVTCSPECRNARRDAYERTRQAERQVTKTEVVCLWCDTKFIPATHAKTCSPECRAKYARAKKAAKGKGLVSKVCVICGAGFKTGGVSNRVITCSAECRAERARQTLSERQPVQNERRRGGPNRRSNLLRRFGLTEDDYLQMLEAQGGRCAICGTDTPGTAGVFAVDHDHTTGAVRGLLCRGCNIGIGNLGDDVERLRRAIEYLQAAAKPD